MITQEIRTKFLNYFKNQKHSVIPSSAVIPHDDPTLLFINAGMNQFKDVFLGKSIRDYDKAVSCQKCIRVGGKHNDLDNVGHTSRHLTFFEMLGNFSFGDYFKEEAIRFAWEVSTQVFGFEPEKLWPTVYKNDDEAFELWKKYVPESRITRFGEKENFWAMGDTGPCGPCSEILYDRGSSFGSARSPSEDPDGERYLEFWNLVFMQFNKDHYGHMNALPKPSIDTGAGLERVVSLKMGVESVFATDIFRSLIAEIENLSRIRYDIHNTEQAPAFHVIADHLRSLSFAIADGVQPSNVDRGYVLRKILRRAVRYGRQLGFEEPFLAKLLPRLIDTMGQAYPELSQAKNRLETILTQEEDSFFKTLKRGGNMLTQIISDAHAKQNRITGDDAFKLKDTYGFPLEEITLLAKDAGLTVDLPRFEALEKEAKERSRASRKAVSQTVEDNLYSDFIQKNGPTQFLGYIHTQINSKVLAILVGHEFVSSISEGCQASIILESTPFYAEMGGQVSDKGTITGECTESITLFQVEDCQTPFSGITVHHGTLEKGTLHVGSEVTASVDIVRRQKIANNHTATHLLHWALNEVLGSHIKQAGSIVDAERIRFDFSHHKALSAEEIQHLEDLINQKIRDNQPVQVYELNYDEAQTRADIKQFFGEKYGAKVRVIDIDYSKELCGGTHTSNVGKIGYFRIVKESSISQGVRRIEAVTGPDAEIYARQYEEQMNTLSTFLKVQPNQLLERAQKLLEENKLLSNQLIQHQRSMLKLEVASLLEKKVVKGLLSYIIEEISLDPSLLKECADQIMQKSPSLLLLLGVKDQDRCQLLLRVSPDLISKGFKANELIREIASIIEGNGGGKPESAQAGGKLANKLSEAVIRLREIVEAKGATL